MKNWFRRSKDDSRAALREALAGKEPPTFQAGVASLLADIRNPDTPNQHIVHQLESHPALVVGVLRMVNSAAFGMGRQIDTLDHAVALLGRSALELFVLGQMAREALPLPVAPGFDARRFWTSSFARAGLARTLSDRLHPAEGPRCFVAGLLQDMAVPLAASARPQEYGKALEAWHASPEVNLSDIEQELLGWTHEELGAHLGVVWELPDSLVQIIGDHHAAPDGKSSGDEPGLPAVRLVSTYRETLREFGLEVLVEQARSRFELDPDWVLEAVANSEKEAKQLAASVLRKTG